MVLKKEGVTQHERPAAKNPRQNLVMVFEFTGEACYLHLDFQVPQELFLQNHRGRSIRFGEHDIQPDTGCAQSSDLFRQQRHAVARPWPLAEVTDGLFIQGYHHGQI